MNTENLPGTDFDCKAFSEHGVPVHEDLVNLFGCYFMWARNQAINGSEELVTSEQKREGLARIFREPFDEAAQLSTVDRNRAIDLARATVDSFAQLFLRVIAHQGIDFRLGDDKAMRFRLDMEIVDTDSEETIMVDTINRNCEKHFADYWGLWLNRYGKTNGTEDQQQEN